MDKKCGIYCIKNLINDKVYIGKTNNLKKRWKNHLFVLRANTHSNKHLQVAFNKYGESSFEFSILLSFTYFDNDELSKLEIECIKKYKSYINTFGYNKTLGGDGRTHTEESKLLIKERHSIPILQYDLKMNFIKEWSSMREAANELNIYESGISVCVNGKSKFSRGFIWKRRENPIDYIQKPKNVYMGKPFKVNQYTLENILLKTWTSISEASRQTKTSKSSIIRCCKNKQKTANNFIWKYLNS